MEVLNGSVHKTTNGGQSWSLILSGTQYPYLYDVDFVNANEGWAVGGSGKIYHTTNGGANWVSQPSGVSWVLREVSFISASTGYVVGSGGVLVTTDGGQIWTQEDMDYGSYSQSYRGVAFPNPFEVWVTGDYGTIGKLARLSKDLDYQTFLPLVLRH